MLAQARSKPAADKVTWVCQDLSRSWPLKDDTFDLVLSCLVLEHVQDVNAFFREMARLCKPHGIVLTSAIHPNMFLKGTRTGYKTIDGQQHRIAGDTHRIGDYISAGLKGVLPCNGSVNVRRIRFSKTPSEPANTRVGRSSLD